jgi:Cu/Ag efflux protein CusF
MTYKSLPLMVILTISTAAAAAAQKMVAVPGDSAKATVVIQQIDSAKRMITFRAEDGTEDTIWAGPEVKRFNELKVGDKINMTYYESKIFQVRPAGTRKPGETDTTSVTRGTGTTPGVTLARQSVETVTVKSIDRSIPSSLPMAIR